MPCNIPHTGYTHRTTGIGAGPQTRAAYRKQYVQNSAIIF